MHSVWNTYYSGIRIKKIQMYKKNFGTLFDLFRMAYIKDTNTL